MNYVDAYRNIYIAMNQKILATVFEMSALVISATSGYLLGCTADLGIWAVEFVYLGSVALLFIEYHFYFKFGSGFAEYRSLIAEGVVDDSSKGEDGFEDSNEEMEPIMIESQIQDNLSEIESKMASSHYQSETAQKDEIFEDQVIDHEVPGHATKSLAELESLRTYTGFLKFSTLIGSLGFLTTLFPSSFRILISFKVNQYEFAAFSSVLNLINLSLGLLVGFSSVMSVDLSKIMMTKDIPNAKRYITISI